jgi:hypothetical protein
VPFTIKARELETDAKGRGKIRERELVFEVDEGVRRDTTLEGLAKLRPAFHVKGTVTAGNSSQTSDGAAAALIMSTRRPPSLGLKPMARFVSFATGGVAPEEMGIGPVVAIPKALKAAGLELKDIDLIELNEAFCRAGVVGHQGVEPRLGTIERQRRRDCAGPSTRLHGREVDGDAALRNEAAWRALWDGDDVRGRRHGRGGHLRELQR